MRWFKHMTNSSHDEKLVALESEFGLAGYGFFWKVLEQVGAQVDESGKNFCEFPTSFWRKSCGISAKNFEKMLTFCEKLGIFYTENTEIGLRIYSPNILKYRDEYTERQQKKSGVYRDKLPPSRARVPEAEADTDINTPHTPLPGGCVSLFDLGNAPDEVEPPDSGKSMPAVSAHDAAQKPVHTGEDEAKPKRERKPKGADLPPYSEQFESAWAKYPRKTNKHPAWRAYYELDSAGEIPPDLPLRIENRALEEDWNIRASPDQKRYIPHMSTWLHRRGWEDEGCFDSSVLQPSPYEQKANEIAAKYNHGMPSLGDTGDDLLEKNEAMNRELEALEAENAQVMS